MKRRISLAISILFIILTTALIPVVSVQAADLRAGDEFTVPKTETNLKNLYVAGSIIQIDAPVTDDLVIAGGTIATNNTVTGNILAAGGNVTIKGHTEGSVRIAGGTIIIDGKIDKDLAVMGGSVIISKTASISGDVLFAGGKLQVDGPVGGKVLARGGDIMVNNTIGKNIEGQVGTLTLGSNAHVKGDLLYASSKPVAMKQGADVEGDTRFQYVAQQEASDKRFLNSGAVYNILAEIIIGLLLITFLAQFLKKVFAQMTTKPFKIGAIGFAYSLLFPLAGIFMFILLWLGFATILFYGITIILSIYLSKIFIGWFILRWYEQRSKKTYNLDWRAAVVGPIVAFLLTAIPFVGWAILIVLFFISLGALVQELVKVVSGQGADKKVVKKVE